MTTGVVVGWADPPDGSTLTATTSPGCTPATSRDHDAAAPGPDRPEPRAR